VRRAHRETHNDAIRTFAEVKATQREGYDGRILLFHEIVFREPLEVQYDILGHARALVAPQLVCGEKFLHGRGQITRA
jgi:hypothetical protein